MIDDKDGQWSNPNAKKGESLIIVELTIKRLLETPPKKTSKLNNIKMITNSN
jgi:hypothetical protein